MGQCCTKGASSKRREEEDEESSDYHECPGNVSCDSKLPRYSRACDMGTAWDEETTWDVETATYGAGVETGDRPKGHYTSVRSGAISTAQSVRRLHRYGSNVLSDKELQDLLSETSAHSSGASVSYKVKAITPSTVRMLIDFCKSQTRNRRVSLTVDRCHESFHLHSQSSVSRSPKVKREDLRDSSTDSAGKSLFSSLSVSVIGGDFMFSVDNDRWMSTSAEMSSPQTIPSLSGISLTCPHSEISNIDWIRLTEIISTIKDLKDVSPEFDKRFDDLLSFLNSVPGLKEVDLNVNSLTKSRAVRILSLIQTCPSLQHISVKELNVWNPYLSMSASVTDGEVKLRYSVEQKLRSYPAALSHREFRLYCPQSVTSVINWTSFLHMCFRQEHSTERCPELDALPLFLSSLPGLNRVDIKLSNQSVWLGYRILSLIQTYCSLQHISFRFDSPWDGGFLLKEEIGLQMSQKVSDCSLILTGSRCSVPTEQWKCRASTEDWTMTLQITGRFPSESERTERVLYGIGYMKISDVTAETAEMLGSALTDVTEFTSVVESEGTQGYKSEYRLLCSRPGRFKCRLTQLVFVMEGKGEVLYRMVPWETGMLDQLAQAPAGPCYSIDCSDGPIGQLHLPHCEIHSDHSKDHLAVVHVTQDGAEIMQPLELTDTHVIVDVKDCSIFGLIRDLLFSRPVSAQVLLFSRPVTSRKRNILNVHLLPGNVPSEEVEVKQKQKGNRNVQTAAKCELIPGRRYSVDCEPDAALIQPESEVFICDYGPNYHPTFEVFLDIQTEELNLKILDKEEEVWKRLIPLTGHESCQDTDYDVRQDAEFVDKHRAELIQKVAMVMPIADELVSQDMLHKETYAKIHAADTNQEKMREVFSVLDSGGDRVKSAFCHALRKTQPVVVQELEGI